MGFLKDGKGFDWNGNGKKDTFDHFMNNKLINESKKNNKSLLSSNKKSKDEELKGILLGGKPLYDASKDRNGAIIVKCLLVTILCIGGMTLPIITEMKILGKLICIFGALGLSILILKNT